MAEQNTQPSGAPGDWLRPIPWDVLRARCLTAVQGRVLFVLWSRCNRAGNCFTGIEELGSDAGCDARTATAAVDWLAKHGVIAVERPSGRAPRYHLDPDNILAFVQAHPAAFPKDGDRRVRTPHNNEGGTGRKNVGGTKMTPHNNEGGTPYKIVVAPPTKLRDEEDPLEEDPLKNSPSSVLPVLPPVEPTEPAPPQKSPAKKPKADKPPPDPRVRETMLRLEALQGPFAIYPRDAGQVKAMLCRAEPDEIIACWKAVKADPWWAGKPLGMAKLNEFLTLYQRGELAQPRAAPATNGTNGQRAPTSARLGAPPGGQRKLSELLS